VTGAAQGLGFAIAKRLNDEGCKVAMLDINEEKVSASAAQLSGCFGMKCDVSSAEDISRAVKAAAEKLGGVDILVNNAGILHNSSIPDTTEKEWDTVMAVNLKSVFFMVQQCLPYLKESGSSTSVLWLAGWAALKRALPTPLPRAASSP